MIARFLADGTADTEFGTQGVVIVPLRVPDLQGAALGHVWFPPTDMNNKILFATSGTGYGLI